MDKLQGPGESALASVRTYFLPEDAHYGFAKVGGKAFSIPQVANMGYLNPQLAIYVRPIALTKTMANCKIRQIS